jgi:hypothetical protein
MRALLWERRHEDLRLLKPSLCHMCQTCTAMSLIDEGVEAFVDRQAQVRLVKELLVEANLEYVLIQDRAIASPDVRAEGRARRARPGEKKLSWGYEKAIFDLAAEVIVCRLWIVEILNPNDREAVGGPVGGLEGAAILQCAE